jgi:hypothetical protein
VGRIRAACRSESPEEVVKEAIEAKAREAGVPLAGTTRPAGTMLSGRSVRGVWLP